MNILEAIIFGLLQGLTEFLPVSSSGHLFLLESFLGLESNHLPFFVLLHFATLMAVLVYFWPQIVKLKWRDIINLGIATLPIIPFTLVIKDFLPLVSDSTLIISIMLLLTSFLNLRSWLILKSNKNKKQKKRDTKNFNAFKIGIFQALGIFPGISRSGITLNASLSENMNQEEAVNFTFLLAIPAIAGATVYELLGESSSVFQGLNWALVLPGMLAAFLSGLWALKVFKKTLKNNQFIIFAIYCFFLAAFLIGAH